MGEPAVDVGSGVHEVIECEVADDSEQQHAPGDVPHPPERGDVGGIEQVFRGKSPGTPG
jgi:hypothetical protein